jgi:uncharacterized membrane protein YphA (DoxX/SURF4 family)
MNAVPAGLERACALAGRVLIAWIFLRSGAEKLVSFEATSAMMAGKAMPVPRAAARCAARRMSAGRLRFVSLPGAPVAASVGRVRHAAGRACRSLHEHR